jgi:hypothetical protein
MLCDSCLHKTVCKEIENFKKYNKQYEEMKEVSSLFDKPIECPCYMNKKSNPNVLYELIKEGNKLNKDIEINCIIGELLTLVVEVEEILDKYQSAIDLLEQVCNISIPLESYKDVKMKIDNKYEQIKNDLESLVNN